LRQHGAQCPDAPLHLGQLASVMLIVIVRHGAILRNQPAQQVLLQDHQDPE
jgi:hypothetical protein